jgi:hypothetical protein
MKMKTALKKVESSKADKKMDYRVKENSAQDKKLDRKLAQKIIAKKK